MRNPPHCLLCADKEFPAVYGKGRNMLGGVLVSVSAGLLILCTAGLIVTRSQLRAAKRSLFGMVLSCVGLALLTFVPARDLFRSEADVPCDLVHATVLLGNSFAGTGLLLQQLRTYVNWRMQQLLPHLAVGSASHAAEAVNAMLHQRQLKSMRVEGGIAVLCCVLPSLWMVCAAFDPSSVIGKGATGCSLVGLAGTISVLFPLSVLLSTATQEVLYHNGTMGDSSGARCEWRRVLIAQTVELILEAAMRYSLAHRFKVVMQPATGYFLSAASLVVLTVLLPVLACWRDSSASTTHERSKLSVLPRSSLQSVLARPLALKHFEAFLLRRFQGEYIFFWRAVRTLQHSIAVGSLSQESAVGVANTINHIFLSPSGPFRMPLPADMLSSASVALAGRAVDNHIFDDLLAACQQRMGATMLPRFLNDKSVPSSVYPARRDDNSSGDSMTMTGSIDGGGHLAAATTGSLVLPELRPAEEATPIVDVSKEHGRGKARAPATVLVGGVPTDPV